MTILSVFPQLRLDGLVVATYAHGLETIGGVDVVSGRRTAGHHVAYHPGVEEVWEEYPDGKVRRFDVWALPNDADGQVTFANGPLAHLQANVDAFHAILAKRSTFIDVQYDVPLASTVETRQARGKIVRAIPAHNDRWRRWSLDLFFPFPYWNVLPQTLVNSGTPFTGAQVFTVGGGARVHDILVTATANGTITHAGTGNVLTVVGATGPVAINCRSKTVTDNGVNAPGVLTPSHPGWLWMDPGSNTLTVAGTTMSVAYYASRE